jgi:hypothetical protein
MSTLSEIVQRAFRESQILDINRPPSASQEAEAVTILRGIILRNIRPAIQTIWLGNLSAIKEQKGVILKNFTHYTPNIAVPQDCYVNLLLDNATTLLLPPSPGDGSRLTFIDVVSTLATNPLTVIGNGNLIAGNPTATLATNNENTTFMFRRDLANWIPISPASLVATAQMPFTEEFDDLFVIELAMRLNPRYGKELNAVTIEVFQEIRSRFKGRYMSENNSSNPDSLWETFIGSRQDVSGFM